MPDPQESGLWALAAYGWALRFRASIRLLGRIPRCEVSPSHWKSKAYGSSSPSAEAGAWVKTNLRLVSRRTQVPPSPARVGSGLLAGWAMRRGAGREHPEAATSTNVTGGAGAKKWVLYWRVCQTT